VADEHVTFTVSMGGVLAGTLSVVWGEWSCDRYALFLLDNENLLDLWDLEAHPNLTIRNGIIFFHLNRKLCLYKIYNFRRAIGMDGRVDDADISPTNNGDQVACKLLLSFHVSRQL